MSVFWIRSLDHVLILIFSIIFLIDIRTFSSRKFFLDETYLIISLKMEIRSYSIYICIIIYIYICIIFRVLSLGTLQTCTRGVVDV